MQQLPDQPPDGDEEMADINLNAPSSPSKSAKTKAAQNNQEDREEEQPDVLGQLEARSEESETVKTNPFIQSRTTPIASPPMDISDHSSGSEGASSDDESSFGVKERE